MREVLRHSEVLSADIAARLIDAEDGVGEIEFDGDDPQLAFNAVETQFGQCDVLVSASPIAVPRVFVSDMDSTMIGQECIDELADYAGLKPQIAEITERAMQGELDFEDALRERVALLKGLGEDAITQCLEERIRPTPGARTLTKTLRAHGARTVLVTGGFHHFADVVGQDLGFERVVGNRLAVADGKLTGELAGPITDAGTKAAVLAEESERAGEGARSLSTGDGANDIPMIQASDYGFAYRAKPKARAAANGRIDSEDHTAVLLLLGIARSDWVEG
ncbi:MAG: phosphoserine phosphatase SerB [Pseudomonadota bacterium]